MTRNQSIRIYEVECLRKFVLGVIAYRSTLPATCEPLQIIAKWNLIKDNLDNILSDPERFRSSSDKPIIDLFTEDHNKGKSTFSNLKIQCSELMKLQHA